MSDPVYFLGIDLGSSSIKTSLFDPNKGKTIDSVTYPDEELDISSKKKRLGRTGSKTLGGMY